MKLFKFTFNMLVASVLFAPLSAMAYSNLHVTQSNTPVRPQQLIANAETPNTFRVHFSNDGNDDVDTTFVAIQHINASQETQDTIRRLVLYRDGESHPIAFATRTRCAQRNVPSNSFCADLNSHPLIVPANEALDVLVGAQLNSKEEGAKSGKAIMFGISKDPANVEARAGGDILFPNNGDTQKTGEIFIGTTVAEPNADIMGTKHISTFSKIVAITNANEDLHGTNVPTGEYDIAAFTFEAAAQRNGARRAVLDEIIFTVNAKNVLLEDYVLRNKAHPSDQVNCRLYSRVGDAQYVQCRMLGLDAAVEPGATETYVLTANILDAHTGLPGETSHLQVLFNRYHYYFARGMGRWTGQSFIRWLDAEGDEFPAEREGELYTKFFWFDLPDITVASTAYQSTKPQADLYITQDTLPVPHRQLLGGELSDTVLRLDVRAAGEDIDVQNIVLTDVIGASTDNVNRLQLFKEGEGVPFASASRANCLIVGHDAAQNFCAIMEQGQLVVSEGETVNVLVRALMKHDEEGALSTSADADALQFALLDPTTTAHPTVRARVATTAFNLVQNDGDNTAEGEIFVGTASPAPNASIMGNLNDTVLAKFVSIENMNPDPHGTNVPLGPDSDFGFFEFETADNNNTKNGRNNAHITDVVFTISSSNVEFRTNSFYAYNLADSTERIQCTPYTPTGSEVASVTVRGVVLIDCDASSNPNVDFEMNRGRSETIVVGADILDDRIDPNSSSSLVAILGTFAERSKKEYGVAPDQSHIRWSDSKDDPNPIYFAWIESSETTVHSTSYFTQ